MVHDNEDTVFLPIRPNDNFAKSLSGRFGIDDPDNIVKNEIYSNGEYCPTIKEDLDGRKAFVVYSYTKSSLNPTEAESRILRMTDAAYRRRASEVYLVMAEHLFDRQDLDPALRYDDEFENFSAGRKRKIAAMEGQPFSLRVAVKNFHGAGIKKVLTLDGHSPALYNEYQRIYRCNPKLVLFNLDPAPIFASYLRSLKLNLGDSGDNVVFVAPDKGSWEAVKRLHMLTSLPNASIVFCNKYRTTPNDPKGVEAAIEKTSENFSGVEGRIIIAQDDKGDTMGTLEKTIVRGLTRDGKPRQVHIFLSHMIFSTRGAYELIEDNRLNVHGSNSHPAVAFKRGEPGFEQITVLDFTPYFAWAVVNHVKTGHPLPGIKDTSLYNSLFEVVKKGNIINFS